MNCKKCGSQIESGYSPLCCPHCGTVVFQNEQNSKTDPNSIFPAWETVKADKNPLNTLITTLAESFFNTEYFFKSVLKNKNIKSAWLFGIVTGSFGIFASFIWSLLPLSTSINNSYSPSDLIFSPIVITVQFFAVTIFCQLVFRILKHNKSSFKTTFRIVAYSQGASILYAIPVIGSILSPAMWFFMLVTGLHHANSVGKLKTILILLFPAISIGFFVFVVLSAFLAGNFFASENLTNFFNILQD